MSATPAAIAKYTNDGVVLTNEDLAMHEAHPEAIDMLGEPIEMFFDSAADGQAILDDLFAIRSALNPVHEGIEIDENLRIGQDIPIAPSVPCFRIIDEERGIDTTARLLAFAHQSNDDGYSVEVME